MFLHKIQVFYLILIFGTLALGLQDEEIKEEWLKYQVKFGKRYGRSQEGQTRYTNFKQNLETIIDHNQKYENGEVSYEMGLNEYSDMDYQEFENLFMGAKTNETNDAFKIPDVEIFTPSGSVRNIPSSKDWRTSGAVTNVKNQKQCGSCWAFSAVAALESQYIIKHKRSVLLSEQNLVDCDNQSFGCSGGYVSKSYDYIRRNGGIDTEKSYPYRAVKGKCNFQRANVGATCTGFVQLPFGNEQALLQAVATVGPISVSIHATNAFQHYSRGVFVDNSCTQNINHAVLAVGYGTENGRDYWLIKNSWGTNWGENGYIKMSRNKNNQCGIGRWSYYPKV